MAPNSSRCQGDFFIQPSTNPEINGYGNLKVAKDISLVGSSATVEVNTLSQPLSVKSAKALSLTTLDGDISANPVKTGTSGSLSLNA